MSSRARNKSVQDVYIPYLSKNVKQVLASLALCNLQLPDQKKNPHQIAKILGFFLPFIQHSQSMTRPPHLITVVTTSALPAWLVSLRETKSISKNSFSFKCVSLRSSAEAIGVIGCEIGCLMDIKPWSCDTTKAPWQGERVGSASLSCCVVHHNILPGAIINTSALLSNFKLYN